MNFLGIAVVEWKSGRTIPVPIADKGGGGGGRGGSKPVNATMTHSLDNGEVYFPIEGGLAGGRDTYPRRELTRSKAFP